MTTKLNDLQLILLSHAAKTEDGRALPLPDTIADQARAQKELKALLRRGFLAETETTNPAASWREDGNIHFGLAITGVGKVAINLGADNSAGDPETDGAASAASTERKPHSSTTGSISARPSIRAPRTRASTRPSFPRSCSRRSRISWRATATDRPLAAQQGSRRTAGRGPTPCGMTGSPNPLR